MREEDHGPGRNGDTFVTWKDFVQYMDGFRGDINRKIDDLVKKVYIGIGIIAALQVGFGWWITSK